MMENHFRKIAAHRIKFTNGDTALLSVVFIKGDQVVAIQPLKLEEASTEWLPGTILIETDNQNIPHALYKGKRLTETR